MTQSTRPPMAPNKYYLYDDARKIVFIGDSYPDDDHGLTFLGTSDNPSEKMAAAVFLQRLGIEGGWTHKPLSDRNAEKG
jgi:hypothetical protein